MFVHALAVLLFATLQTGAPAQAVTQTGPNCQDDSGVNRCSEAQQRQVRARYGVPSIEEHAKAGEEARRIFYVDGYGNDFALIAFVRAPGRDPEVRIHFPASGTAAPPEPTRAPVPQKAWEETVTRGANFDRSFVARPGEGDPGCLHAWVYTIEAAEPNPFRDHVLETRRKTENACEEGPGSAYAQELQDSALALFPACAALDPEQHRNAVTILSACRILGGDRLAAAEVMNRAGAFRSLSGVEDANAIGDRFSHQVEIDWAGKRYTGPGYSDAARFWMTQLDQPGDDGWTSMELERVEGETGNRVRLTGSLSRSKDMLLDEADGSETAKIDQIWVRDENGAMQIERATIGPWRTPSGPRATRGSCRGRRRPPRGLRAAIRACRASRG